MIIPFWFKIVGPLMAIGLLVAGVLAWGHSKYRAGHKDGVAEVDAEWRAANEKLKAQAANSATKADDRAAERLDEQRQQAAEDRKAVEDATANGSSPLDALFGG